MSSQGRSRVLMLVHRVPLAPDRGDRIRSYHLLKFLARRADVWLATLADEPSDPLQVASLEQVCHRVAIEPLSRARWLHGAVRLATGGAATTGLFHSARLRKTVSQWLTTTQFDAVLVFCSSMLAYAPRPRPDCPVVVDLVDVDSEKWVDYAARARTPARWLFGCESRRLRRLEQSLEWRSSAVTLVSEAEAALCRPITPGAHVVAVSNGVNLDYFDPQSATVAEEPFTCVFVGALDYRANIDGLTWFAHEVWPGVVAELPQARLSLVGRAPTSTIQRLGQLPGIEVVGSVPDVRPHLARASVAIVPLRIARGIQNKVLEAAAMRKATVVSPAALEGLGLVPDRDLLVADSPSAWRKQLSRALADAELRNRLGTAAREYVVERHSWDACLQPFAELLGLSSRTISTVEPRSSAGVRLAEAPS
ncbi:MAG: TIGR03087 family PEP-CTERM/XrtA system glycosyltransferase [Pirellulales bacterium]